MSREDDLVLLRTRGYRLEGEFAQSALEAAGIQCALFADDAGGAEAGLSFSNPARLMVRQEELAAAQALQQEPSTSTIRGRSFHFLPRVRLPTLMINGCLCGFFSRARCAVATV